jgi:hypothetical protein
MMVLRGKWDEGQNLLSSRIGQKKSEFSDAQMCIEGFGFCAMQ